jgi:hypothetical protein
VLFELTIAHRPEGGSLGFLKDIIHFNVAHGRAEDVCLVHLTALLERSNDDKAFRGDRWVKMCKLL